MAKVIGIAAHVDAGKTTLSEQVLHLAGVVRSPGRVDHGDAFLDADPLERSRGITIWTGVSSFSLGEEEIFWVDTPGHSDFSPEMERAVAVLDAAVLVVSAAAGIQSHTEVLWELLRQRGTPVVIFLNKTDLAGADVPGLLAEMRRRFSPDLLDLRRWQETGRMGWAVAEEIALRDEGLLETMAQTGTYDEARWTRALQGMVMARQVFPVMAGSALIGTGVEGFLRLLNRLTATRYDPTAPFGALVWKVRRDEKGGRLCCVKVLSGQLSLKDTLTRGQTQWKVNDLRRTQGDRTVRIQTARAGELAVLGGMEGLRAGDGLGFARDMPFSLAPMMAADVLWGPETGLHAVLSALRQLEEEEPTLQVAVRRERLGVRVMGRIQLEILQAEMARRFGLAIRFGPFRVLWRETIAAPAVGVGHYEPLRHYAEVWLRLEPGEPGSGIRFRSEAHVDDLSLNWQRLIETHVFEREHHGVLTGSPLTDVTVVLLQGRAHLKHTEGGDFRQAVYRAIRNALMGARSVLLEPLCAFEARFPIAAYGAVTEAMASIGAALEPPEVEDERVTLRGEAPYALFQELQEDFPALIRGRGTLRVWISRYAPCRDQAAAVAEAGYNPLADPEDTPESVFCAHGAGFNVAWDRVRDFAHLPPPET